MSFGTQLVTGLLFGGLLVNAASSPDGPKDPQTVCKAEKTISKTVQSRYLLYLPEDYNKDENKQWPLVVFLHGAGERGDNLEKVKVHGPPRMTAHGKQFPFILVSPQCPEGSWWDNEEDALLVLLEHAMKDYRVDKSRVYLTGISMGGFGTWSFAAEHPEFFAAIAPICGGGEPIRAGRLKDMPMWVFHGAKDDIVPIARSQEMADAVTKAGGDPKFTIYPEANHDSWSMTYTNQEFWDWLLAQRRSP